uniref:Uncharacterized protein n=1 Tax=Odontella aurita TaxID=265563 RepID=A0A7S4IM34_9STRA|eukprot:CAMPEP_0113558412 /NCGR_PEP_ID=MMETSP0015_2-20120614/18333_1 /TAXON_ID=2838 /ORGANISM="Odontella" /LENGTH=580 /DNA_ID=CAMNT_0000459947 /DNA_START=61 /DNA_END=1803 /DNA_ORIENTATION=+ /assembly_acc=CAM_ASM_000160
MAIAAMGVIDISADIGEYLRALDAAPQWSRDMKRLREGRKAVFASALQSIICCWALLFASTVTVSQFTKGIDHRMVLILSGLSRLQAATFVYFISVKTPRWVGIYHSAGEKRVQAEVDEYELPALRFHVRWSVAQYFGFDFFLLLPFCGHPLSALLGVIGGFGLSTGIYYARRAPEERQATMALVMAFLLAAFSSLLFARGCNYIQVVWGKGRWMSEWVLAILSFTIWLSSISLSHRRMWHETEMLAMSERGFSAHDRDQRMPMSILYSHFIGSHVTLWMQSSRQLGHPRDSRQLGCIREGSNENKLTSPLNKGASPTTWELIKIRCSTTPSELGLNRGEVAIWVVVCLAYLFLVVVNIGATAQMKVVKENFHSVHEHLYGAINEGPVCAFNKVRGEIATFDDRQKARAAGYNVAHCGACGACSDWHNMGLQHTTRKYLAAESARCAKKSLIGGPDAVTKCLNEPPITFQGKCAECWTEDIICARNNCAFIFLQSNLINTVGNFQVGSDTITAATCEEAMCELVFVPCVGANRRRMNIQSTIQRPGDQQCGIVDVGDWDEVFGDDGVPTDSTRDSNSEEL